MCTYFVFVFFCRLEQTARVLSEKKRSIALVSGRKKHEKAILLSVKVVPRPEGITKI